MSLIIRCTYVEQHKLEIIQCSNRSAETLFDTFYKRIQEIILPTFEHIKVKK